VVAAGCGGVDDARLDAVEELDDLGLTPVVAALVCANEELAG